LTIGTLLPGRPSVPDVGAVVVVFVVDFVVSDADDVPAEDVVAGIGSDGAADDGSVVSAEVDAAEDDEPETVDVTVTTTSLDASSTSVC
jgi:hypothetical protein